jgi:hypothetical protein
MPLDYDRVRKCLDEIDAALFSVADSAECEKFHRDSQLTAVVLLALRMSSLVRSLLALLPSESFDGFDAVLRAFEETWYLGHELRLSAYHDKAMAWLAGECNTWSAKISVLLAFGERRGHHRLNIGRDYNLLSELAHPTATAAQNSLTVCLVRRGLAEANAELTKARENNPERIRYALYRLGWLVLDGDPQFIPIPVAQGTMPLTEAFLNTYEHVEPGT